MIEHAVDSASRIWAISLGDLRILSRGRWWWIVRLVFATILVLSVYAAWPSSSYSAREMSRFGTQVFGTFYLTAYACVMIVTPAIFGRIVASGKLHGTSSLLLSTPARSWEIVAGKFFSHFALLLLLLSCGLPVLFSSLLFGGVSGSQVLSAGAALLILGFLSGSLTTFFSTLLKRPYQAALLVYMAAVGLAFVTTQFYFILSLSSAMGGPARPWAQTLWLAAPHVILGFVPFDNQFMSPWLYWLIGIEAVILGFVFLGLSSLLFRRMILRSQGGRSPRVKRKKAPRQVPSPDGQDKAPPAKPKPPPRPRKARAYRGPIWNNPVAWSEVMVRRGLAGRVGVIIGVVLLSLVVIQTMAMLAWAYTQGPGGPDGGNSFAILQIVTVYGEIFFLCLLTAGLAGSSMGEEREGGSMDLIAVTPLSSSQIFMGKFTGILRILLPLWIFMAVHLPVSIAGGLFFTSWDRAFMGFALPVFLVLCVVFIASLGLLLSLFGRSSTLGVTATLGAIAVWWIVVPLLLGLLDLPMEEHASGANPFVAVFHILALWIPGSDMAGRDPEKSIAPIAVSLVFLTAGSLLCWGGFVKLFDRRTGRS
jgi:ABC-type transport system involved in multi-copper enzyme maturation permease subunit